MECTYKRSIEARSRHDCYYALPWKERSVTYSECLSVALVIQHPKRMLRTTLSSVACPVLPYFSTLSHKSPDFRKKKDWWNVCFDRLYNYCPKYFSFLEEFSKIVSYMYVGIHAKYPLFLTSFNKTWLFPNRFSKNFQVSNFMKIRPVGTEFVLCGRTDGQTWQSQYSLFAILRIRLKTIDSVQMIISIFQQFKAIWYLCAQTTVY